MAGAEGTVTAKMEGGQLEVALAGNTGMGGQRDMGGTFATVPATTAFVMITDALTQGNLVRVLKGVHVGRIGVIAALLPRARFNVNMPPLLTAPAETAEFIIEHIDRIYPDEIETDSLAPGQLPTRSVPCPTSCSA